MKRNNETKVTCPKCGAEFEIAEKTHITIGVSIGKDSGLGVIHPKLANENSTNKLPSKAEDRISALKAKGIDVSGFFSMKGADGGEYVGKMENGKMEILSDDDPIYNYILDKGDVYNPKLARRWVMAQMFHMLAIENDKISRYRHSLTEQIRLKGYDYSWTQLEDELYAQYLMFKNGDSENFNDRNRWFNRNVVYWMMNNYLSQLSRHVSTLKVLKCKGIPYKRVCGENIFVSDIEKKLYEPIKYLISKVHSSQNPLQLCNLVVRFNDIRKSRGWKPSQSSFWIDAYKGAGAFFTMQNMIRYHNCRFYDCCGGVKSKDASYKILKEKAVEYKFEGWRMIGLLRQFLKDNNIDINAKMAEWRKRK